MNRETLVKALERLSVVQKVLILCATIVIAGGAFWWFLFNPKWERIGPLEKERALNQEQVAKFSKQSQDLPRLEQEYESQKIQLTYASSLLPENVVEIERLLADIERLGRDVGIEFLLFVPGGEAVGEHYASRTVTLKLSGPFHNLMIFFNRMARFDRLVSLETLTLRPSGSSPAGEVKLAADATILIYRALSTEEIAAKDKPAEEKKPAGQRRRR